MGDRGGVVGFGPELDRLPVDPERFLVGKAPPAGGTGAPAGKTAAAVAQKRLAVPNTATARKQATKAKTATAAVKAPGKSAGTSKATSKRAAGAKMANRPAAATKSGGGVRSSRATKRSGRSTATTAKPAGDAARATSSGQTTRTRTRSVATPVRTVDHSALRMLGVSPGERVRFRRQAAGRWTIGIVVRRERDGSIGLTGPNGAARAIPIERIEVSCTGPRGAQSWEPLTIRASRSEQLRLL